MKPLALLVCIAAMPLSAQSPGRTCNLVYDDMPDTSHSSSKMNEVTQKRTSWWGGGFKARCRGTKMIATSDSAEYTEEPQVLTLIGHARYREDSTAIDARTIRYTVLVGSNASGRSRSMIASRYSRVSGST